MCGIAGIIGNSANQSNISAMLELIRHRGPDGRGIMNFEDKLVFGHVRLSIQDLTDAGAQPMCQSNYTIVFNGEIYNHLALRKKYFKDHNFIGHSDTETILLLFSLLGEKMVDELVGMWSLVIFDKSNGNLFFSRDRFGQKPLYYAVVGENFYFCSEIKALLPFLGERKANIIAISEYLGTGNYEHLFESTFFEGIKSFPPASFCKTNINNLKISPTLYWQAGEDETHKTEFGVKSSKKLFETVVEAVESQLLSDVPIGATLSGGIDSSIIVGIMAGILNVKFPVFTAQFPGRPQDETRYVNALVSKYKSNIELYVSNTTDFSLEKNLEKVIYEQEEPFGDPSIIAHGLLMDDAKKQGITVILGGQGGDEVSMGYPWMYSRLASCALRKGNLKPLIDLNSYVQTSLSDNLRLILSALCQTAEFNLRIWKRHKHLFWVNEEYRRSSPVESFAPVSSISGIYLEAIRTVGIPHLTHYDDRSSMNRSIEGRMPFLDHRIIDFTSEFQLADYYKNGFSKFIFREAFKTLLPKEILERKDKIGFFTPVQEMVIKEVDWIKQKLESSDLPIFDKVYLNQQFVSAKKGNITNKDALNLFRAVSVSIWLAKFNLSL